MLLARNRSTSNKTYICKSDSSDMRQELRSAFFFPIACVFVQIHYLKSISVFLDAMCGSTIWLRNSVVFVWTKVREATLMAQRRQQFSNQGSPTCDNKYLALLSCVSRISWLSATANTLPMINHEIDERHEKESDEPRCRIYSVTIRSV